VRLGGPPLGLAGIDLCIINARDLVDAIAVYFRGRKRELEALAYTPARNPRTECCCQPVACMIAAIVVPEGDCNIARTRDCLVPDCELFCFGVASVSGASVVGGRSAEALAVC
jgi:hypothetical protein